ncbi:MAG: valine--tRNA ligase, partial [Deltaproteobacteria bacterium]|nr:valine--tRNA ligase [Deltaproteobacteria bacterium]
MSELSKAYSHEVFEEKWYDFWLKEKLFRAEDASEKEPFCIVIPPPNVTGSLHMGHALTFAIQDLIIRWKRMLGFNALWLPGTDHAGIATQMVVERELAKNNVSRFDLGREKFLEEVRKWKEYSHSRITKQMMRLGVSVDWDRERFTLDEGLSRAVRKAFVDLYEEGLIYRSKRLVNWSPAIKTVLSDLEVTFKEIKGSLWHIAYPVCGGGESLIVATTRPETMLGDTAVAVNPDDPRYRHLIGKKVCLPLTDREIPIIADSEAVDMNFGSGAVKITPGHDFADFETGLRHSLPIISIFDQDARLNENAPERYRGMERFDARREIVADLERDGFLVKIEDYNLTLGHCQRSGAVVEPMVSEQWFVRTKPLAEAAIKAVEEGRTVFIPEEWTKVYFNWMLNIRDWCISRQLWWGHQIPVWYCRSGGCGGLYVGMNPPDGVRC